MEFELAGELEALAAI
jgi:hypothetical protein